VSLDYALHLTLPEAFIAMVLSAGPICQGAAFKYWARAPPPARLVELCCEGRALLTRNNWRCWAAPSSGGKRERHEASGGLTGEAAAFRGMYSFDRSDALAAA
jgi:hypothetical protein